MKPFCRIPKALPPLCLVTMFFPFVPLMSLETMEKTAKAILRLDGRKISKQPWKAGLCHSKGPPVPTTQEPRSHGRVST